MKYRWEGRESPHQIFTHPSVRKRSWERGATWKGREKPEEPKDSKQKKFSSRKSHPEIGRACVAIVQDTLAKTSPSACRFIKLKQGQSSFWVTSICQPYGSRALRWGKGHRVLKCCCIGFLLPQSLLLHWKWHIALIVQTLLQLRQLGAAFTPAVPKWCQKLRVTTLKEDWLRQAGPFFTLLRRLGSAYDFHQKNNSPLLLLHMFWSGFRLKSGAGEETGRF